MNRHFGGSPVRETDKARVLLFLSFSFLILFGALAYLYMKPQEANQVSTVVIEQQVEPEMVRVLIPLRQIPSGTQLQRAMFREQERPANMVGAGTIKSFDSIVGHFAKTVIVKDVPLHSEHITELKPTTAISSKIPPGFRAVTIRVNVTTGVEGWARADSRVDVVWASNIRGQPGVTVIVQNAKVLSAERSVTSNPDEAAAQQAQSGGEGVPVPSTVTLLVSARDAQKIQLASTSGTLSLSLRGDSDTGKADVGGSITVSDLLGTKPVGKEMVAESKGTVVMGGKKWIVSGGGELVPAGGSK